MENATKAFMMAAGVLIGVLILSIAVYLFTIFSRNSEQVYKKMESNQITQFNNQFLKYYGQISRTYIDEQTGKSINCSAEQFSNARPPRCSHNGKLMDCSL